MKLKKKPKILKIIEKDFKLAKDLEHKICKKIVEIINADILKFDLESIVDNKSLIFGNLPYNVSSQILVRWILNLKKFPPKIQLFNFYVSKGIG